MIEPKLVSTTIKRHVYEWNCPDCGGKVTKNFIPSNPEGNAQYRMLCYTCRGIRDTRERGKIWVEKHGEEFLGATVIAGTCLWGEMDSLTLKLRGGETILLTIKPGYDEDESPTLIHEYTKEEE